MITSIFPQPQVIFEDEYILVINKPSGITVNKSDTTKNEMTLQEWIENELQIANYKLQINEESDFYRRSGIVHRLDKETSGIILAAKTPAAFEELQRQFKERIVEKTYIALTHGKLLPLEGEIIVPVGRLEYNRKRFGIVAGGREAVTRYKVLYIKYIVSGKNKEQVSLVELYPKTGRTHQIRVHLKYLQHPIVSDMLYAGRKTVRADRKVLSRLFLHAAAISFFHPVTNQKISFASPLPENLQMFLNSLLPEKEV